MDINNQLTMPCYAAALPSGEAAVVDEWSQVVKINNTGHTVKVLYNCNSCYNIDGLLLLGNNRYVVHDNGTLAEIDPNTGKLFNVYHVPEVSKVRYYCSLWSDPSFPHPDILLLPDTGKGEVFSYNLTSRVKQVHVNDVYYPTCVSYSFSDGSTRYIVTDSIKDRVNIYNSSWVLELAFGGLGSGDGDLSEPQAAIMTSKNSI